MKKKIINYIYPDSILDNDQSNYAVFLKTNNLTDLERIILISTIASYLQVNVFDKFLIKNKVLNRPFTEFGGKVVGNKNIFIPTIETISFIYHGSNIRGRIEIETHFQNNHLFRRKNILYVNKDESFDSFLFSTISLSPEFIEFISEGKEYTPNYSSNFPANLLTTNLNWEDLVLHENVIDEIITINTWLKHIYEIQKNKFLSKKISNGYKALFYGPPGTGKTLTASLLGKMNNLNVYRVDLSQTFIFKVNRRDRKKHFENFRFG